MHITDSALAAAVVHAFDPAAAAVRAGRIPCAAFGAITAEGLSATALAGCAQREPQTVALQHDHFFDLASLTKPILVATEIVRALEDGLLDLEDKLSRHIPDLFQYDPAHPIRTVTILRCLTHTSGLPAVAPIYTWGNDPETLKALVLQRDWPLGADAYSDINFILLGILLERLRGRPLRDLVVGSGLEAGPVASPAVATERCAWRGQIIRGEVHDENAHALGGLAGHAGLFGTLDGVLGFARRLLASQLLSAAGRDLLLRPHTATRTLAWQIAHPGWSGGSLCSPATIGHTGFTGTGLWIDPQRAYAWALLTNRVHPSRHVETGIAALRQAVGNRLAAAMTSATRPSANAKASSAKKCVGTPTTMPRETRA